MTSTYYSFIKTSDKVLSYYNNQWIEVSDNPNKGDFIAWGIKDFAGLSTESFRELEKMGYTDIEILSLIIY